MISGKRHKGDGQYRLLRDISPFTLIDHGQDLTIVGCTHGDHHPAAGLELFKQRGWNSGRRRRHDNGIERRMLLPPSITIAAAHRDIAIAQTP